MLVRRNLRIGMKVIILSNLFCAIYILNGQNNIKCPKTIYNFHTGTGLSLSSFNESDMGTIHGGGLSIIRNNNYYSFVFNINSEFNLLGSEPEEYLYTIELLYGRNYNFKKKGILIPFFPFGLIIDREFEYWINYGIGIAYVDGERRTTLLKRGTWTDIYNTEKFKSIGISLKIELIEKIVKNIGIGIGLYANLNTEISFIGMRCNVYVSLF